MQGRWARRTVVYGFLAALIFVGGAMFIRFREPPLPVIDFATLKLTDRPNQYLVCPAGMCGGQAHRQSPVYVMTTAALRKRLLDMVRGEPRTEVKRQSDDGRQVNLVQRSRLIAYPDIITIRFITQDDGLSSLAIYSRSVYGRSDFGVNKARIEGWLKKLE